MSNLSLAAYEFAAPIRVWLAALTHASRRMKSGFDPPPGSQSCTRLPVGFVSAPFLSGLQRSRRRKDHMVIKPIATRNTTVQAYRPGPDSCAPPKGPRRIRKPESPEMLSVNDARADW